MTSFRVACRSLARRAGFTFIAILTLAVGIAATTTVFSVVDTVLLKALPFPNPERLVTVRTARGLESLGHDIHRLVGLLYRERH